MLLIDEKSSQLTLLQGTTLNLQIQPAGLPRHREHIISFTVEPVAIAELKEFILTAQPQSCEQSVGQRGLSLKLRVWIGGKHVEGNVETELESSEMERRVRCLATKGSERMRFETCPSKKNDLVEVKACKRREEE
ncbi:unnamed protein product [Eruca vesicaria subsp. sativa]|uniref:Uncharacterized protein n=1 Tax=Eruca vesicaria subsp. sativa TaxID=29727 RepID=A0ABC8ISC1_ERUVS|nr:unnamed protein product [Eruca vesicaria subsp. sativa]